MPPKKKSDADEVEVKDPNPTLLLDTVLVYPCPVHGWEAGNFCNKALHQDNRRNWKVLSTNVLRDASEAEVEKWISNEDGE